MLQLRKNAFVEKLVRSFETLNSTLCAKQHVFDEKYEPFVI